ncbi:hypothetical protein GOP47_0009396 [Adiantum capillus-veneris]|uniref:Uncharacterized protein n=1 Tax=Adiantum capillus-veneris TaxID=13818 RepID=A0A9D4UWY0_ADICA|nr:hypothetical protein GOP47_0009396 [Adiantum capillus-veneris]
MINSVTTHPCNSTATLELSTADLVFDYYNSVLLFYDLGQASALASPPASAPQSIATEAVIRLERSLQEMLAHYPCAAGLVVFNDSSEQLEVRYPMATSKAQSHISSNGHKAGTDHATGPFSRDAHDKAVDHENSAGYGVPFHVAHANVSVADLGDVTIPQPALDVLYPRKPSAQLDSKGHPLPRFVMSFQITTFKCGGFTLGHTCSHAYADGYTSAAFLQNLCSIARGAGLANSLHPTVPSRRAVISAREPPSLTIPPRYIQARKRTEHPEGTKHLHSYGVATRFRFTMDALESLRASVPKPCSRNRALVALLWTAFARVSLNVHGLPGNHELDLRVPMNLRTRGLNEGYMGNALCHLNVVATLQELCENSLSYVVEKMKKALDSLDLMESAQSMVDYVELQLRGGRTPFVVGLGMTSLVGLPFYDTDCGWGAPTYLGRPSEQLSHMCIILDHPAAGAWNALVVFASPQEHACFQESIADYIS